MEREKNRKARGKAVARVPMMIHMDADEYAALVEEANSSGRSMQVIVRDAVARALHVDGTAAVA